MLPWFFYGTLLDGDVFKAVTGKNLQAFDPLPAKAHHFRKVFLPGQSYPTLIGATGGAADGLVCRKLPKAVVQRIHAYEGPDYTFRRISVSLGNGARLQALTYFSRVVPFSAAMPWKFDDWVREGREITLRRIRIMGRP